MMLLRFFCTPRLSSMKFPFLLHPQALTSRAYSSKHQALNNQEKRREEKRKGEKRKRKRKIRRGTTIKKECKTKAKLNYLNLLPHLPKLKGHPPTNFTKTAQGHRGNSTLPVDKRNRYPSNRKFFLDNNC